MKIKLLLTTLLLFCLTVLNAAPFKNVEKILIQPDGTKLHCYASGDEFYSRLHDKDGFTIVQAENGYFVYATKSSQGEIVATQHIAGKSNPKTLGLTPNIKISQKEYLKKRNDRKISSTRSDLIGLNHGVYNNLVVFIKFKGDADFSTSKAEIDSMFNHNGYHAISMNNYYKKATYNQLAMNSYCYPKADGNKVMAYEDIYPRNYYIPYNETTNPNGYKGDEEHQIREFALLKKAIEHIADEVPDTLNIDRNEDGLVDNVIFVVNGNTGDWGELLWPHMWELGEDVFINGKKVSSFNFQLETSKYFTVSTLCHEMAHSLGFPDSYHYNESYDYLSPTGPWDLMSDSSQPPQHTPTYMKYKYGTWIDEIPEIGYGTYTIEANSWEGGRRNCYKIPTSDTNQFYLVEYRNKENIFEKGLPDGGLLIYRLDTRYNGSIEYNNHDILDELYIFRPGGTYKDDGTINTAAFYAENNKTMFNSTTDPYPFLNFNEIDEKINICNISTRGDNITFSYLPPNSDIIPTNLTANVNKDKYVELKWDTVSEADSYNIYRDGILIAKDIKDTFYDDEYQNIEKGYHCYYVSSNCNGEESFRSDKKDVFIGECCEYVFNMNCIGDNGWQGAEIRLSFNNGMDDIYLTIYSGNERKHSIVVPTGIEMYVNWTAGWNDSNCSFSINNNGNEVYKSEALEEGLLTTINTEGDNACIKPNELTAMVSGFVVDLKWNSNIETDYYTILCNNEVIADSITSNFYTDRTASNSGTHNYTIVSNNNNCESQPSEPAYATIMKYNQDMIHVDGTLNNDTVKLEWNVSTDNITHNLCYDNGEYITNIGGNNHIWGIMIPKEKLSQYQGAKITAIEIFDATQATYNFNIYNEEQAGNTPIHSESFKTTNSKEFVRFELSKEISFDSNKNLWLTAKATSANPPIPCGKFVGMENSNLIKVGSSWKSASNFNMNYSWMIRLHLEQDDNFVNELSYNIYREDSLIASNIKSTKHTDFNLTEEKACYRIGVVYNNSNILYSEDLCFAIPDSKDEDDNSPIIYPNPTKDYVKIKCKGITNVKVYSITGAILFETNTHNNEIKLDMSKFPKGIYLIHVATETETKTYKLVRS
jgi:M6 family metalloprotease-like protein